MDSNLNIGIVFLLFFYSKVGVILKLGVYYKTIRYKRMKSSPERSYLDAWLSHKVFVVGLQCQSQARRLSPVRRHANQQLLGPFWIAVLTLGEHTWETQTHTHKISCWPHWPHVWPQCLPVTFYRWRASHSEWPVLSWTRPCRRRFLPLPVSSGSWWRPKQPTCSPGTEGNAHVNIYTRADANNVREGFFFSPLVTCSQAISASSLLFWTMAHRKRSLPGSLGASAGSSSASAAWEPSWLLASWGSLVQ